MPGIDLLTGGPSPALVVATAATALDLYLAGALWVGHRHPANPVPLRRPTAFAAGLAALVLALVGPIDAAAHASFAAHMAQHLILIDLVAPLLLLAAPVTLLLRCCQPRIRLSIVGALHSRPARLLAGPIVGWTLFAAVMWWAHLGPLFEASLESPAVHLLEHALFLAVALWFWLPIVAADPQPGRLGHGGRIACITLAMAPNLLLGWYLYSAGTVLYPHDLLVAPSAAAALADQRLGGLVMWLGGDAVFSGAAVLVLWDWVRRERIRLRRVSERLAREAGARG
ncbi:MAG TPA: cytochrome c oxidase assembly protein [Candidatus Limnocylindrales bacterium]|nr:cytochrome c oxidase assembly protein [Candidatus Limnocylindrales bacterium]